MKNDNINGMYSKYSSSTKSIKIHLANFKYNHKDSPQRDDIYINRATLENKLLSWLIGPAKSGVYLVAGYRGMGKSSLVNHVIDKITRQSENSRAEFCYAVMVLCIMVCTYATLYDGVLNRLWFDIPCTVASLLFVFLMWNKYRYYLFKSNRWIALHPRYRFFEKDKLKRLFNLHDLRQRRYNRIQIKINLGQEVIDERDVLSLLASQIRTQYARFLRSGYNKPLYKVSRSILGWSLAYWVQTRVIGSIWFGVLEQYCKTYSSACNAPQQVDFHISAFLHRMLHAGIEYVRNLQTPAEVKYLLSAAGLLLSYCLVRIVLQRIIAVMDSSQACLRRLKKLTERVSSSVSEADSNVPSVSNSLFSISLFNRRNKVFPLANVRDIEVELSDIINTINSRQCFFYNRVQFLIVLDELDKVEGRAGSEIPDSPSPEIVPPDFSTAIDGFSGNATNSDRRRTILRLLANMKLFLTSANAKFIFISGRELYEAFLADLSDREFAISSIFSGVINVHSFLSPEREQSAISTMTEQYISECVLPRDYLEKQMMNNLKTNRVLKREVPSFRWCLQYLTEQAQEEHNCDEQRCKEIRYVIMMLQYFSVYLSHVSNGSPKKIALYFEKYVNRYVDSINLTEWDDTIEVGKPREYVLNFAPNDQQKIGFICYLAAPIMNVIMSNVSNYGDKLLVVSSFIVDHLFKFHGRGFSWRNIEQAPELLDMNKTPELRDFINSIVEYMEQIYLYPIMVGLFQYKFRRRLSEEISYISRISDEAAAIFNFTLNESQSVKQHNIKLLNYYVKLNSTNPGVYDPNIARIHQTLGDLYFQEEDYSRAVQGYRNAYALLCKCSDKDSPSSIITQIRCLLKLGLTHEYRKTYNTAYLIYCRLIDNMISIREMDEHTLGLDIVDTWTDDWRVKQPIIVDYGVRASQDTPRPWPQEKFAKEYPQYRDQFINAMWDDYQPQNLEMPLRKRFRPAEYSLDFDQMISRFSNNLSPEKSNYVSKLSMFEDVRLIYKAILAKLFILEKMTMSGITQSNIEIAEAEFKYLHRTINIREKFFISADFFNQLGKILFYKNSVGILKGITNDYSGELLYTTLYWWNLNLYAYLDDFCFKMYQKQGWDAIVVKRSIKEVLGRITWSNVYECIQQASNADSAPGERLVHAIREAVTAYKTQLSKQKRPASQKIEVPYESDIVKAYVDYIAPRISCRKQLNLKKIDECCRHRTKMRSAEWNLPCYACKYYNQSLHILCQEMFVMNSQEQLQKEYTRSSKSMFLLRYSFSKYLRYTRVNHLRLLSTTLVSMGDTQYSCAAEKRISAEVLYFLHRMLEYNSDSDKEAFLCEESLAHVSLTKLDKAQLYYLAAYRYFKLAKQPADAVESLMRIMRLLNEYVTIMNFDKKTEEFLSKAERKGFLACADWLHGEGLFQCIFTRMAKLVGERYDYNSISELYDFKWVFHANMVIEDINLKRLQMHAELKELIWMIADTRIKALNIHRYFEADAKRRAILRDQYREEIVRIRGYFSQPYNIKNTFYNEIITNYAHFRINKWTLKDMLDADTFVNDNNSHEYRYNYTFCFLQCLEQYLNAPVDSRKLDYRIFKVEDNDRAKIGLVEFLLEDSITCLTDIIFVLTPHNHISAYTDSFTAEIYSQLWEYTKMYEILTLVYNYRYDAEKVRRVLVSRGYSERILAGIRRLSERIQDDRGEVNYGRINHRLFARIRHKIDDRTLHHIFSNYAIEMALTCYSNAESAHSEGSAYKRQIDKNYLLNDDLDNDTLSFNTTLERFRLHTSYIGNHKKRLIKLYKNTRFYPDNYNTYPDVEAEFVDLFDKHRFDDSLHVNTEF